jgi:Xaa-Pro aminopeptidase
MTVPFDGTKLTGLMADAGLDLVLASTRHNIRYLTGGYVYHFNERCQRAGSSQYLAFVGVPRQVEDAFYVGAGMEQGGLGVLPMWVERRELRGGNVAASATAAAETARTTLNGGSSRIGVEMPFLPAQALATLQASLPSATFVDATDLLHELRAIKTEAELRRLEAVSDKVAEAIQAGFRSGREGITTRELAANVEREMGARGLSFLWAFTNAGPGYVRAPSEIRWQRGRMLHLDCGGEDGDYLADICRMGALGEPAAIGRELTEHCLEIQGQVRRQLRAGLSYGEVQAAADQALGRSQHAGIGRIVAHGIGMVSHEQPMINVKSQAGRRLEVGHVLSVETEFHHPEAGHVKIEDTIAIVPEGARGLGDLGRELQVVTG